MSLILLTGNSRHNVQGTGNLVLTVYSGMIPVLVVLVLVRLYREYRLNPLRF